MSVTVIRGGARAAAAIVAVGALAITGALTAVAAPPADPAAPATPVVPGVVINEVSAAAWNGTKDADGEAKDWVELYNPTSVAVNLTNWGLSNKSESHFRWVFPAGQTIPANGYLAVWLSKKDRAVAGKELHASFNLDNGADSLFLTIPDGTAAGTVVDQAAPPLMKQDWTWCRMPNGSGPLQYCAAATKGKANSGSAYAGLSATPTIAPAGGVYAGAQTVTLSGPAGAEIRYTTDGNEPTSSSTLYKGPFSVPSARSVRAVAFEAGKAPSLAATESYAIDAAAATKYAGQRVIMVTMTAAEKLSYQVRSKSALFAPAIDMHEADGKVIYKGRAEASVGGQIGSNGTQTSVPLNVKLREALGAKSFSYDLFPNRGTKQSYTRFRLRNSGSDWYAARLRDQLAQRFMAGDPGLWADYSPTVVFLNGQYNGLMDLREAEDETLVENRTGTPNDAVQYISDGDEKSGGAQAEKDYADMISWFRGNSMAGAANYAEAKKRVDVQNVASVTAAYGWAAVWDWPWRNMNAWRTPAGDNLWRYQVHDFDISMDLPPVFGFLGDSSANVNPYSRISDSRNYAFASLLKNPDFKNLYVNTVADQLNDTFAPARTNALLDEMAGRVKPYIPTFRAANPTLGSAAKWESEDVARLRGFLNARNPKVDSFTRSEFKLSARQSLTVQVDDTAQGGVQVNSLPNVLADVTSWTGSYYPEVPVTLTAKPKVGYTFVRWEGSSTSTRPTITLPVRDAALVKAIFEPVTPVAKPAWTPAAITVNNTTGDKVTTGWTAVDPAGYPLTYSAKKLPKGIDIDPATGRIWGTITTPGTYATTITATNGTAKADLAVTWNVVDRPGTAANSPAPPGRVQAEYWKNRTLTGTPANVEVAPIALDLGTGAGPLPGYSSSSFSIRWSTMLTAPETGTYQLRLADATHDGVRIRVDGGLVLDKWADASGAQTYTVPVTLTEGRSVSFVVEFVDYSGAAKVDLSWSVPGSAVFVPIPASAMTAGPAAAAGAGAGGVVGMPAVGPITTRWWNNLDQTGGAAETSTTDTKIGLSFGTADRPLTGFGTSDWSVRWNTTLTAKGTGVHRLRITDGDRDGVRVFVGDFLVHDDWAGATAGATHEVSFTLTEGVATPVRVDFVDISGAAKLELAMQAPGAADFAPLPAP